MEASGRIQPMELSLPAPPHAAPCCHLMRRVRQFPWAPGHQWLLPSFQQFQAFLAFLCFLLLLLPAFPAQAYTCAPGATVATGLPEQAYFHDPSTRLTVTDVAAAFHEKSFQPIAGQLADGYTRDAVWLRLCLPPAAIAGETRWLRFFPPMLDDIRIYIPREGGWQEEITGDHYPFATREWNYRLFTAAIPADLDISQPIYVRIHSTSSLNLRLDLWGNREFQRLIVLESAFYGGLAGTLVLLVIFSLISWRWLKEPQYLYYGINVLTGGILLLLNAGFGSQFIYPETAGANDYGIAWLTGPILSIHVLFFTHLFAIRQHLPRLYPFMWILAFGYGALAPLSLFTDWRNVGVLIQFMAIPTAMTWVSLLVFIGFKDKERRAYIFAFTPWVLGLLANAILRMGSISEHFLINYSSEITGLFHLILLPILIINRTRKAEREKDRALARELQEAHRVERELEGRVSERTAALQEEIKTRGRLQQQLQEALAMEQATLDNQRQLVAMLSHEFRTPLSIIDTVAQRLEMGTLPPPRELPKRIGKIRHAVARLLDLLENCLADERLNGTGTELRLEALNVNAHLQQNYGDTAVEELRRIRLTLPSEQVTLHCDHHLFGIALGNLVSNALKYSPAGSTVDIRLLPSGGSGSGNRIGSGKPENGGAEKVCIEIRDQGPGIPPEDRERIFERFVRGSSPAGKPGTGLGLHLARLLARRHGGDVELAESGDAPGATFILTLPRSGIGDLLSALP